MASAANQASVTSPPTAFVCRHRFTKICQCRGPGETGRTLGDVRTNSTKSTANSIGVGGRKILRCVRILSAPLSTRSDIPTDSAPPSTRRRYAE